VTGFLDIAGAAQFLSRSPRWLRQHVHEIPHYRPGGQILFDEADLRKWMLRFKVEPTHVDLDVVIRRAGLKPRKRNPKALEAAG
jgi:hypothetical protein